MHRTNKAALHQLGAAIPEAGSPEFEALLASKASEWLGVPALLIFFGDRDARRIRRAGGIWFDNTYIAQLLGTMALAYILFYGGGAGNRLGLCQACGPPCYTPGNLGRVFDGGVCGGLQVWAAEEGIEMLLPYGNPAYLQLEIPGF